MQTDCDQPDQWKYRRSFLELTDHCLRNNDLLSRVNAKDLAESLLQIALKSEAQGQTPSYMPQHITLEGFTAINLAEIGDECLIEVDRYNTRYTTGKEDFKALMNTLLQITADTGMKQILQGVILILTTSGMEEALVHLTHRYKLQELTQRYKYVENASTDIDINPPSCEGKTCIERALLVESDIRLQLTMTRFHFCRQQSDFHRTLCSTISNEKQLQTLFEILMKSRDSNLLFVLLTYSYEHNVHLHYPEFSLDTPLPQAKTPLLKAVEEDSEEDVIKNLDFVRCACHDIICLTLNLRTSYFTKYITALMLAAWKGNILITRHLLTELGMQTEDGRTALMLAAWKGNYEVMKLLLPEAGMVDRKGKTALMYAASRGHLSCVEMLLKIEAGRQRWWDGSTALIYAAKNNWPNVIDALVAMEAKLQTGDGVTALMIAAQNDYLEVIDKLSRFEACMQDDYGNTALMGAAIRGHINACKLLLPFEKQMQNTIDETSLILAVQHNHVDCVKLLIDEEAGFQDIDGHSALMWAAKYGNSEFIKLLKRKESNLKDAFGRTALYYAEHPYWRVNKHSRDTCIALLKH
ncbi:Protein 21.1 [Giardia lamblia P15]|uniref:Protein 21.1 n=1 Tax=Giardia intestinalis (strain P15) TaxID=658858 RepID=E1F975_GIAIA|nr:Protein 21.1 [Giardia lamblia P15]